MKFKCLSRLCLRLFLLLALSMCTPPNTDDGETSAGKEETAAGSPDTLGPVEVDPEAAANCSEAFSDGRYGISSLQAPLSLEVVPGEAVQVNGKGEGEPAQVYSGFGIALRPKDGIYWDDPRYSAAGYDVIEMTATDKAGVMGPFTIVQISEPKFAENFEFLASESALFVKPIDSVDYVLLSFNEANVPALEKTFKAADLTAGQWLELSDVKPSSFAKPKKYAFITAEDYSKASSKTNADLSVKLTAATNEACFAKITSPAQEAALYQAAKQFNYPPGHWANRYSKSHEFPTATLAEGGILVMWQDQNTTSIYLTMLSIDGTVTTQKMPVSNGVFKTFTTDGAKHVFYLTSGGEDNPKASLVKASLSGELVQSRDLGIEESAYNIFNMETDLATLSFKDGKLALLLARKMQKSSDGLNHQASTVAVVDAETLADIVAPAQSSSHSFDIRLHAGGDHFYAIELGDAYPRGINLSKIGDQGAKGRTVYTFKTQHMDEPSPYYKNDDGSPLAAGKWSNDNTTYTELGDILELPEGYLVVFSSEKSTDPTLANGSIAESRNLGVVLAAKDFDVHAQEDYIVNEKIVISPGEASPDFGFYTFQGWYRKQKNVGVRWLTSFDDPAQSNASRVKVVTFLPGRNLVLFERWNKEIYLGTHQMLIDNLGNPITAPQKLAADLRLPRSESIRAHKGDAFWVTANGNQLEFHFVRPLVKPVP